ncbi:hypothetical protein [Planomicrobium okeanokoites]|uniref:Lipoprotein n=1 Tax=Planomicrobium okeanokoites TaxID=244 RepID=A0ABV7KLA3_PLAOK|nr:hypothetical protein [Planomicrobium okeanokoites]TAA69365.1 hypothetical protein D2910_08480 [Planomicrobium okeanokoites]
MKKITRAFYFSVAIALLAGCGNDVEPEATDSEQTPAAETPAEETEDGATTDQSREEDDSAAKESETSESEDTDSETGESELDAYSSEQIEYARVWLQLGPNQEIDGLYVKQIPSGTPLNPNDETSGVYPEDVIQLAGSRLVDGSVTYSGNGDGTINVYNVPLRWDGEYPAGEEFYEELINDTELVEIDTGDDEEVIRLIKLQETE